MTLRFLLDTNVVTEPLRPHPDGGILERLRRHQGEIAIASIVWHELWFGCRRLARSARRSAIERYLSDVVGPNIPVLPYGAREADWHAAERARLTGAGLTPAYADGQIASIAVTHDLTLVTADTTDFQVFNGLQHATWRSTRAPQ